MDPTYSVPPDVARRRSTALIVGVVGLAVCVIGFFVNRDHFFRAYLIAYLFWLGVALGSLAMMMVHHQSGGAWGLVIRRIFEAASRTLPALFVLFLPLLLGLHNLYPWTHADHVQHDPVLVEKAKYYLNVPFFVVRLVIYFASWIGLALVLNRWSQAQDDGDVTVTRKMQLMSGPGLVLYGLTITFASVDWVMSLNPHWFSTIFGFLFMGGQGLKALAFAIVIATMLSREGVHGVYNPGHFHDLGKLMLAFVMLWAYFNFSQYLLIYSGNLTEEIPYYLTRTTNGWGYLALLLVIFHFAVPFSLLLSRNLKRHARTLAMVALAVLVMREFDLFFLVSPEFAASGANLHMAGPGEEHGSHLFVHWLDLAAPIGLGGVWLWLFFTQLAQRPLLPLRDPQLTQALESTGGH
jgi:hypothetical protein